MIKKIPKVWGSEEWIVNNDRYCGKILKLKKGFRSSLHYHKNKHETFFILSGEVLLELEGKNVVMKSGDVQTIEPLNKHRFTGLKNSKIIEFSTHHEDSDSYREIGSERIDIEKLKKEINI
ncbi:cupin domain-containing protein [Candidatus Pacearchaeota archaeon]|nr:cupin domain-containing protein [Candidatus Pacearchaeota archaeon]